MSTREINLVNLINIWDTKFILDSKIKQHLLLCANIMVVFSLPAHNFLHFTIIQDVQIFLF